MEFVSIPWENGCDDRHHSYKQLTVNLALWFTHILAGNHYKLDWKYRKLREEELVQTLQLQDRDHKRSGESSSTHTRDVLSSQTEYGKTKRKRQKPERMRERSQELSGPDEEQEKDTAQFSFYETSVPPPIVR